uniref:Uncharacterized protein n=1 Tax=Globodera pallida TaxID=36090 RepID=A0A183CKV9_GLOPA
MRLELFMKYVHQHHHHQANPSVHQFESHLRPHRHGHKAAQNGTAQQQQQQQNRHSVVASADGGPTTSASWQWDDTIRQKDEEV